MGFAERTPAATALQHGAVEAIHVHAPGPRPQPMVAIEEAVLEAGTGIRGDRYAGLGIPGTHITFIAAEGIEAMVARTGIALTPAETRRNVLTRGVDVNALVGRRFRVGDAICLGVKPCTPCDHLESVTRPGVRAALSGQGGLRADVLVGAVIRPGDQIEELDD
ncbi:MAG: MOSC domain-containing protein [Chloroflexi bacterium]|nr:MAG: MOSC domain-containing protein [Chloroflexota bacterium]